MKDVSRFPFHKTINVQFILKTSDGHMRILVSKGIKTRKWFQNGNAKIKSGGL